MIPMRRLQSLIFLSRRIFSTFLVFFILSISVSAESKYITMDDWGFGTCKVSSSVMKSLNYISDTSSFSVSSSSPYLFSYWAFPVSQDYTYTCTMTCHVNSSSNIWRTYFDSGNSLIFYSNCKVTDSCSYCLDGLVHNFSFEQDEDSTTSGTFTIIVSFNPSKCGISVNTIYLYYLAYIGTLNGYTLTVTSWGCSAEFDPNGDYFDELYSDYLDKILNYGEDYPLPSAAASNLDQSVADLSSAEGAVSDKSSSLADSVSSEWSSYKDQAKALVATVKPSAVVFTTTFATVVDAFPDEVKALLVAVPLIIFIGWLIGRVRG